MTWKLPGLSSTVSPGLISSPFTSSRMRMTPSLTAISCTSTRPAKLAEPPVRLSVSLPLLVIFRKPPPTFAPPGVARAQGAVTVRSPSL